MAPYSVLLNEIKANLIKGGLAVALTMGNKTFSIATEEAHACLSEQGLPSGSVNSAQTESGGLGVLSSSDGTAKMSLAEGVPMWQQCQRPAISL